MTKAFQNMLEMTLNKNTLYIVFNLKITKRLWLLQQQFKADELL